MQRIQAQPLLDCDICLEEIPVSELTSDEARDYVAHYYGLACYQRWSESAAPAPLAVVEDIGLQPNTDQLTAGD
jgi:hypothetical protein